MQKGFHLQITEGPHTFVMASDAGIAIVDRKDLGVRRDDGQSGGVELRHDNQGWTAARLAHLLDMEAGDWAQAIFLENDEGATVAVVAQQVRVIEKGVAGAVAPFNVVGCMTRVKPVFNGVWVSGDSTRLILDRRALAETATGSHSP